MPWQWSVFTSSSKNSTTTTHSTVDDCTSSPSPPPPRGPLVVSSSSIITATKSSPRLSSALLLSTTTTKMLPYSVAGLGWQYQIPLLAGFFTVLWLALKLWRSVRERQIRIIPASWNGIHAHQWSLIQCLTHRATCCVCRSLIVDAMFCDSCGVCLDFACYQSYISRFGALMKKARAASTSGSPTRRPSTDRPVESLGQCKSVSTPSKDPREILGPHQWIHGNLPANSKCFICSGYCDDDDLGCHDEMADLASDHTLYHYRCCWCQRTVHEGCFEKHHQRLVGEGSSRCDYGKWKRFILPPGTIIHRRVWSSRVRGRAIALEEIKDFRLVGPPDWEPLFVVANRKSGNNDAGTILSRFLTVLNPLQVIDLSQDAANTLELALQIIKMLPSGVQARILVAGGDGTVGWVLDTVLKLALDPPPALAILPLGTGNDLARVLGWNAESPITSRNFDRQDLIETVYSAEPILLDRWTVDIRPNTYYSRSRNLLVASLRIPESIMPPGNRTLFMYNYFSVGVDALVTLNFHEARKSRLYKFLFTNTLVNKFLYFTYGTKDLWERRCANLHTKVILELDGVIQKLPELESIVLCNIPSWGGGARFTIPAAAASKDADCHLSQQLSDGLIEVFGLTSTFHIGQVMIGLSKPLFLGQARTVKLTLDEHLPVQADGEPWLQSPAQIDVSWHSSATVLKSPASSSWIVSSGDS